MRQNDFQGGKNHKNYYTDKDLSYFRKIDDGIYFKETAQSKLDPLFRFTAKIVWRKEE